MAFHWRRYFFPLVLAVAIPTISADRRSAGNSVDNSEMLITLFAGRQAGDATQAGDTDPVIPVFKLHGIVIADTKRLAYLSVNGSEQREVPEGQAVIGRYRLRSVAPDGVLIRNGKQTIVLKLEASQSGQLPGQRALSYRPPAALPAHAAANGGQPVAGIKQIQPDYRQIDRALIKNTLNGGEIFSQAKIVPNEDGGFFIERIKGGSLIEAIGLRVGDTIQTVNDQPMTNIFDAIELYEQLDQLQNLEVRISRHNRNQYLHYELK